MFGSAAGAHFVLDTVFVVGEVAGRFTPVACELDVDAIFRRCTVESLATDDTATVTLTLFRGASVQRPVEGMFSFVPCLPLDGGDARFARPAIELPDVINPVSRQSPSGAKVARPLHQVVAAWSSVVDQVIDSGDPGCLVQPARLRLRKPMPISPPRSTTTWSATMISRDGARLLK